MYEQCNTVSNLAYYRTMLEMSSLRSSMSMDPAYVDALIKTFSMSAVGSSIFHAAGGHEGDLVSEVWLFSLFVDKPVLGVRKTTQLKHSERTGHDTYWFDELYCAPVQCLWTLRWTKR